MKLATVAWSLTWLVLTITSLVLFADGYGGYGLVTLLVGLSAALNLT